MSDEEMRAGNEGRLTIVAPFPLARPVFTL